MRVLVAGAGAVGQWLGGRLLQDGHDTTLLCRPLQAAAISGPGLFVRGATTLHGHPKAVTELEAGADPYEAIVVTCKAHQTAAMAQLVAPHLAPHGILVSLQNGLGNGEKLRHVASAGRIALALTSHGLTLEAPGKVLHAGTGPTLVGPLDPTADGAARIAFGLFTRVGLEPEWRDRMRGPVWRKALVNHAINPVAALHGVPNGKLLEKEPLRALSRSLLDEGLALAQRARAEVGDGVVESFEATVERTRDNLCSMLQDVKARRPTEIEQISGRLVRLGEQLLVAMPRSDSVYGRVKDLEASYLGPERARRLAWEELAWEREPF
ncbi:MAG TPA: ketopantoate reductase family protein [Candidatus Thermoplasmatota archaeon]|nr:ketopantoate reductase family protein [Candidatus Thermoplasmatota archaeon]